MSLLGLNLCFHGKFFTLLSWFPNRPFPGNTRTNQALRAGLLAVLREITVTTYMGSLHSKYVGSVSIAFMHRHAPQPLDWKQLNTEPAACKDVGLFAIFLFPKQNHPCTNTGRHTRAREGTAPSRRPFLRLTVAEEKRTHKHGCSHQHSHPSQRCSFSPSRRTDLLSPSQGVNQEHFPFFAHFVIESPGQLLMGFPSSFSEKKCLSDDCQRCGQNRSPKGG